MAPSSSGPAPRWLCRASVQQSLSQAAALGGQVPEWGGWGLLLTLVLLESPKHQTKAHPQMCAPLVPPAVPPGSAGMWGRLQRVTATTMLHCTRPWPHGPFWLPLAARTAALSLRVSLPPWHPQAHRVSFAPAGGRRCPGQQGQHSHCSRWHCRDGAGNLSKWGWPLERWGSHCPLPSLRSGEGDWSRLCWGGGLCPTRDICGG